MQSTVPNALPATSLESPSPPKYGSSKLVVCPTSLLDALAAVPDLRRRQGTRFPLPSILALAVAAILSNHLSVLAIAQWGASQCHELLALGFASGVPQPQPQSQPQVQPPIPTPTQAQTATEKSAPTDADD